VTVTGQNFGGLIQAQVGQGRATIQSVNSSVIVLIVPPDATTGPIAVVTSGGEDISVQTFQAAPRISRFYTELDLFNQVVTPVKGVPGQPLTLEGFNFSDPAGLAVYLGNLQIPATASADTQILATLVTGAQSGPIKVVTSAGSFTTTGLVYFNPRITSFTPRAAAGTTIDIYGASLIGTTSVLFGSTPATFTVLSNTNLQAVVPNNAVDGKLTITAPGGSILSSSNFFLLPGITGFSPAGGPAGTVVTLTGTGLRNATSVQFGSVAAQAITNLSSTQITAVVPSGTFTAPITVTTLNGTSLATPTPFYLPPRIDGFDPPSAQAGTTITLTGVNFTGATQVLLGGTNLPGFTVASTNRITVVLPDGAPSGRWRVVSPGGSADSANSFTSVGRIPILSDFTPKVGAPGTVVTLTGINLANATKVEFNGLNASFTVNNNSLLATVPATATTGPIRVTNPAGQGVSAGNFSVGTTADLRATLTPSINPAIAYSPLAFGIRLVNRGALPALNTKAVLTLPDGVTFDTLTGVADFDVVGRKVTLRPGTLDPNATVSASARIRLAAPGSLSATLEATSDTPEATPADNSVTVSLNSTLPQLTLESLGTSLLTLQWPSAAGGFLLETSPTLQPPTWSSLTNGILDDGNSRQLILSLPDGPTGSAVYRLRLNTPP
jgi:hypothetical protein